ncbi:flagellar hook-basal body complex protein FliE [Acidisphaera rubrifaciens]|uniref:Flagellar hook-basal body complex protein FliE n=1 Tax=Acidisphaera rubrifaciens HS-AP3 TaxID=1231350 RepID=A0A0D6P923_9PROT|nr:flagellar hook-basal body complex protein FliE [Acidisphaera rubrifaciens]GAN78265.1 flagellar hook-basal body complex protein FleE [Acidisphaera rubrifaciens HS-AP3]
MADASLDAIPNVTVVPSAQDAPAGIDAATAAGAYGRVDRGDFGRGFGDALQQAMQGVVDAGHAADAQTMRALSGQANVTDVVTAVSRAELALQTASSIRDRVVQAYQDIMKMPI